MAFTLDQVVPWGRSYDEYVAMFALSESDLGGRILGCGDGPAAFNSVLTQRGGRVVSADPAYQFSADEIRGRIAATYPEVMEQTRRNRHEFVWRNIASVAELGRVRMAAMEEFLADYPAGRREGRYVAAALPDLPFADGEFDLALCSHFLFLYSGHLSEEFHVRSIAELCRVAREAQGLPAAGTGRREVAAPRFHPGPAGLGRVRRAGRERAVRIPARRRPHAQGPPEMSRAGSVCLRPCRSVAAAPGVDDAPIRGAASLPRRLRRRRRLRRLSL